MERELQTEFLAQLLSKDNNGSTTELSLGGYSKVGDNLLTSLKILENFFHTA